ncbi:MAG: PQQ-binding-like beta-propeller repeat protein [Myxococcota bacterium]
MGEGRRASKTRRRARGSGGAVVLAALLSVGGSGCKGLNVVANPDVPLWVNHPGSAMRVSAQRPLTAPASQEGEFYERGKPTIDAVHRRVFVGTRDDGLYALRAADLSTMWRFQTAGAVQGEALYNLAEDAVYFGSNDGAVYKLRAADGAMQWRFATNAEVTRKPILHDGHLFVVNANDTLISIDPANGKLRWFQSREPAAGMEISGYAGVAAFEDRVYTAFSDGIVMAYAADDGREAWPVLVDLAQDAEQSRGDDIRYFDVDTTPVVGRAVGPDGERDAVFVASYEGGVHALDAETGGRLWVNDAVLGATELMMWEAPAQPREGEPAGARRHRVLVASSGLSGVWGLNPDDGAERWRRDLPAGGVSRAEPWAGALLVGTTRYGLFLIHPLDGAVLDGIHRGGAFATHPSAYGRKAFVLSNGGVFLGLSVTPPAGSGLPEGVASILSAN